MILVTLSFCLQIFSKQSTYCENLNLSTDTQRFFIYYKSVIFLFKLMVYYSKWKTKVVLSGKLTCSCPLWCQRLCGTFFFPTRCGTREWFKKSWQKCLPFLFVWFFFNALDYCSIESVGWGEVKHHTFYYCISVTTLNPKTVI